MKPSYFWVGLLAVLLLFCAVMLPRRDASSSITEPGSVPNAPSPSDQISEGQRLAHPESPVTNLAARLRQDQAERRSRQDERMHNLQLDIEKRSALTGESTNTLWRLWEESLVPQAEKERRWAAEKARHREEDLAKGVRVEMWKRQDELERLSAYLRNGMSLQEVKQLLGPPSNAQAHVLKPGVLALVPVPIDQVEEYKGALTLVYSPGTNRNSAGLTDVFHSLHADIGADKTLVGFSYHFFGPF